MLGEWRENIYAGGQEMWVTVVLADRGVLVGKLCVGVRSLWEDNVVVMGSVEGLCVRDNVYLETV